MLPLKQIVSLCHTSMILLVREIVLFWFHMTWLPAGQLLACSLLIAHCSAQVLRYHRETSNFHQFQRADAWKARSRHFNQNRGSSSPALYPSVIFHAAAACCESKSQAVKQSTSWQWQGAQASISESSRLPPVKHSSIHSTDFIQV